MKIRIQRRKWMAAALLATVLSACGGGGDGNGGIGLAPGYGAAPPPAQKIIIDSDYNTMSDDGQLGVMAAQLQASGKVQVMGISVVSGNQWLKQGVADALMSVERLGVGDRIGVYAGANYAFNHDYATIEAEMAAGAGGDGYLGAWSGPEPKTDADLKPSPDGFATRTVLQRKSAVDFIVDTVKANPNEITILAIGPLTNIALAVKQNPEIVPLIKKIIYMGGAIDVAGNTTKFAEFNWWFDPEAVRITLRAPFLMTASAALTMVPAVSIISSGSNTSRPATSPMICSTCATFLLSRRLSMIPKGTSSQRAKARALAKPPVSGETTIRSRSWRCLRSSTLKATR